MKRILFVCHGNICRSPMAEFIMKKLIEEKRLSDVFYIDSAAVSTEELGNSIYPPAQRMLTRKGIPFEDHRARQISRNDYFLFDLIIYMDESNLRWLHRIFPDDPEGKMHLMMDYVGERRDVADPWYTGDYEATYNDLDRACRALLKTVS